MKKQIQFLILLCTLCIFTQCSSNRSSIKLSRAEQTFNYAIDKLQEFQGALWLFRYKTSINPRSYSELKGFIQKHNLVYDDIFSRIDYSPKGYDEKDDLNIHFLLKVDKTIDKDLKDSIKIEIEADVSMKFLDWKSSIAFINGRNIRGKIIDKEKEEIFSQDTTNYYMTRVSEEVMNKLLRKID